MSFKELTAWVQIIGAVAIGGWLINDALGGGFASDVPLPAIATKLMWAIGAVIVFNIAGIIIATILVSIAQGAELKDEKADERDRSISDQSNRNGYMVTSILAALALGAVAFGAQPMIAVVALFVAPMVGGVVSAGSQLVYYRVG
jgi:formate/nitrite transporter FocA (FNT family)